MDNDPAADASQFLLDLAQGKYAKQIADADAFLTAIGRVSSWALIVRQAMHVLIKLNRVTAPLQVVSDGAGGFVPVTNSRYDPKTGQFLNISS